MEEREKMRTVGEVSELTGVSVRALHHYDAVGLLRPTEVTEAGYRLYDERALERLQLILLFRELGFPLREIGAVIDAPGFDRAEALKSRIGLLELQRERTDRLIALAKNMIENGVDSMDFSAFDKKEQERLAAEAREKWGDTEAYAEYEKKSAGRTPAENGVLGGGMTEIFRELGEVRAQGGAPESEAAQTLVARLQSFITENYYNCTDVILRSLGEMYVGDERFTQSIDGAGGEGTALFAKQAIDAHAR